MFSAHPPSPSLPPKIKIKTKTKSVGLDERGITLQTVIITSVLALAAVGVGILVYNLVTREASDVSENAALADELRQTAQNSIVFGGGGQVGDSPENQPAPLEEETSDDPDAITSEATYLPAGLCPKLRVVHWTGYASEGRFSTGDEAADYLPSGSREYDLSPVRSGSACRWENPNKSIVEIGGIPPVGEISDSMRQDNTNPETELFYSFCALKGGALEAIDQETRNANGYTPIGTCFYPQTGGSCGSAVSGISVTPVADSPADSPECMVTENIIPPSDPSETPVCVDTRALIIGERCFLTLRIPGDSELADRGCPIWEISGSEVPPERSSSSYDTATSTLNCAYPASSSACVPNGLAPVAGSSPSLCSFSVSINGDDPTCADIFRIDSDGDSRCLLPLSQSQAQAPSEWHRLCAGWANEESNTRAVTARYTPADQTYRCSINSEKLPSDTCESFGYVLSSGSCEFAVPRSYNPDPIAPLCPALRALPYTSNHFITMVPQARRHGTSNPPSDSSQARADDNFISEIRNPLRAQIALNSPPANIPAKFPTSNMGSATGAESSFTSAAGDYSRHDNFIESPDDAGLCGRGSGLANPIPIYFYQAEILQIAENDFVAVTVPSPGFVCTANSRANPSAAAVGGGQYWFPRHFTAATMSSSPTGIPYDGREGFNDCQWKNPPSETLATTPDTDTQAVRDGEYFKNCVDYGLAPGTGSLMGANGIAYKPSSPYVTAPGRSTYRVYASPSDLDSLLGDFNFTNFNQGVDELDEIPYSEFGLAPLDGRQPQTNPGYPAGYESSTVAVNNAFHYFISEARSSTPSPENPNLEYFGVDADFPTRQVSSRSSGTNYRFLLPYEFEKQGEVECLFDVPEDIEETEENWLKACRNLEVFFPVRFSYHQGLEWNTAAKNIDGGIGFFPRNTFYGTAPTGEPNYVNPIYFDKSTSTTNGHHYCEAHPLRGAVLGSGTNANTDRTASCDDLNTAIEPYLGTRTAGTPAEFKDLTHQHGFVQYREGATDFYTCKWKAPAEGNFLDPARATSS